MAGYTDDPKKLLNANHEQFCVLIALPGENGRPITGSDAYRRCYASASTRTAAQKSYELLKLDRIQNRIKEIRDGARDELRQRVGACGIAIQEERILSKNERWVRLKEVIDERAKLAEAWQQTVADMQNEWLNVSEADPEFEQKRASVEKRLLDFMASIGAGEGTGLLARDMKVVGDQIARIFKVDTGLLAAMNDLEESVAKELGQIVDRRDVTTGGQPFKALIGVDIDAI